MNPPFGQPSETTDVLIQTQFRSKNLLCAFTIRCLDMAPMGVVGAITDSTWLKKTDYSAFRSELVNRKALPQIIADLGWGVLDGANVATCVAVYQNNYSGRQMLAVRLIEIESEYRGEQLRQIASGLSSAGPVPVTDGRVFLRSIKFFEAFPEYALAYETPSILSKAFSMWLPLAQRSVEGRRGYTPGDTFRFFRCWWEVQATDRARRWWTLNNGSPFAPLLGDRFSVAHYDDGWREYKPLNGFRLESETFFGHAGIGYGKRTEFMYAYPLPAGAMFSNEGHCFFCDKDLRWSLLAYLNSTVCQVLINLYCGQHKTAGYVAKVPAPSLEAGPLLKAGNIAEEFWLRWRQFSCRSETNEEFTALLNVASGETLRSVSDARGTLNSDYVSVLVQIDKLVCSLLGTSIGGFSVEVDSLLSGRPSASIDRVANLVTAAGQISPFEIIQYAMGLSFGRWDARIAFDPKLAPKLSDPFDPLPTCPPGMLIGPDGVPAEPNRIVSEEWLCARPDVNSLPSVGSVRRPTIPDSEYPLCISWNGILVDDPGFDGAQPHREDIIRRLREVLRLLWGDKASEIEQEAYDILSVSELREYFRKSTGFFQDHIKRYSKSRRKAPIYWQLATPSCSYAVWLYYQRFTKDTFYKVLNDYVKPKLQEEERRLTSLRQDVGPNPTASQRKEIAAQEIFVEELRNFSDEIARITPLWNPNLNDGVIINFAPLWRLVPQHRQWQKECKSCWDKLVKGDYDWAHLAMHLWPERVVPKCAQDRSLAIANGLEEQLWYEAEDGKWRPKEVAQEELDELIEERTSPTVKAALNSLLSAAPNGGARSRGRSTARRRIG